LITRQIRIRIRQILHMKSASDGCGYWLAPSHSYRRHRDLNKDCGLLHSTVYLFLLSDCLLLNVAPSLSPALALGTTYWLTSPQHHLCTLQKTT